MKYTTRQVIAMVAAIIIVAMALFPPMETTVYNSITETEKVFAGYKFIGTLESYQRGNQMVSILNNDIKKSVSIYSIETTRLYTQLIFLLVISLLLMWAFDSKEEKHS